MAISFSIREFELVVTLSLLMDAFSVLGNGIDSTITSPQKLSEIDNKLKMLNKPAVKSIQSEDGDIVDCVDIYKQPAFDHPALRNHTIQLKPSFDRTAKTKQQPPKTVVSQVWHRSGSCPKGTIPIRRVRRQDLLRAASLENYGRKNPYILSGTYFSRTKDMKHANRFVRQTEDSSFQMVNRSTAYALTEGVYYHGAEAFFNVWNPYVQELDEYSTAQMWLINGPVDNYESIEAGWLVNPTAYGDRQTRLFVYWTADASKTTGCFDLLCSGFVQGADWLMVGGAFVPVSKPHDAQVTIHLNITKDPETGNWWLRYDTKYFIGYWPSSLFNLLADEASVVMWGGEVYSPRMGQTPHTTTQMGSGAYAEGLYSIASFIEDIKIVDESETVKFPDQLYLDSDEVNCYNVYNDSLGSSPVAKLYFGGPGHNSLCP